MPSLRKPQRTTIVSGMILLTLFGSLPATACYCANGHLKPFCAGHYAGTRAPAGKAARSKSSESTCCDCEHGSCSTHNLDDCCHGKNSSKPCGKCCKEISKSLTTTVSSVSMPALDLYVVAVLPAEVVVPRGCLSLRNAQLERIESGPSVDLVIVLRTLLI